MGRLYTYSAAASFFSKKYLCIRPDSVSEATREGTDRDINAAKNILKQGINILSGCGMQSDTKQKRDKALPLGESMTPEAQPIGSAVGG